MPHLAKNHERVKDFRITLDCLGPKPRFRMHMPYDIPASMRLASVACAILRHEEPLAPAPFRACVLTCSSCACGVRYGEAAAQSVAATLRRLRADAAALRARGEDVRLEADDRLGRFWLEWAPARSALPLPTYHPLGAASPREPAPGGEGNVQ